MVLNKDSFREFYMWTCHRICYLFMVVRLRLLLERVEAIFAIYWLGCSVIVDVVFNLGCDEHAVKLNWC